MSAKKDIIKLTTKLANAHQEVSKLASHCSGLAKKDEQATTIINTLFNEVCRCKLKADFVALQKVVRQMQVDRAEKLGYEVDECGIRIETNKDGVRVVHGTV